MKKIKKSKKKIEELELERLNPDKNEGLSSDQVQTRIDAKAVNYDVTIKSKSYLKIVTDNLFTLFNAINIFLAVILFTQGSYKNALFLGVIASNLFISIIQEIRAKRTIDKLSLINETKVHVVRDGQDVMLGIHELVLDDIIILESGAQVPSDCVIIDGFCDCNESLLTGESDAINKKSGDTLFSGSFLVSGKCYARIIHVNEGNFVFSILKGAKYIKQTKSDVMISLQKIIKFVTVIIIPLGLAMYFTQRFRAQIDMKPAIEGTVASMIGMIPEGLILLASTVFAVSVVRLSKKKVMVQDLYCTETLARVDTLCLDKTGTITEGTMEVHDVVPYNKATDNIDAILHELTVALEDSNPTINAVRDKFKNLQTNWTASKVVPFSSKRKWSGATFNDISYVLGAAEFIFTSLPATLKKKIDELSVENRVLVLAKSEKPFIGEDKLPSQLKPIAIVAIRDKVRSEAPATLEFFKEQGVDIKIISGDNVVTVSNIAKRAGVSNYDKYIDLSTLKTNEEVAKAALEYTVFGRVTPDQKKVLVTSLKESGRTVAMTGDGVNDVLALKEADCSIAMASGAEAAKNVSQLVLLDSNFASMPHIVAEGRRSINNLQLSGSLFLVKTIYSVLVTLFVLITGKNYPLVSIQLTLIGSLAVGIPSFILALEPNKDKLQGRFISNIFRKALPGGISITLGLVVVLFGISIWAKESAYTVIDAENASAVLYRMELLSNNATIFFGSDMMLKYIGTISIFVVSFVHFMVLIEVARPLTVKRTIVVGLMTSVYFICILAFKDFEILGKKNNLFEIYSLNNKWLYLILLISLTSVLGVYIILRDIIQKHYDKFRRIRKKWSDELSIVNTNFEKKK